MKEFLEILEIIVKLVQATAWPVVVAFVALKYRQEFRAILKRLEKAKFGDTEFLLGKEQAEEAITKSSEKLINLITPDNLSHQLNQDSKGSELENSNPLPFAVRTADVDGDGKNELVISNPLGAYSSHVRVFKPIIELDRGGKTTVSFKIIGEIFPVNFLVDVKSINSDKKALIIVNEDEKSQPHVVAAKDEITYRWMDGKFYEVSRRRVRELQA